MAAEKKTTVRTPKTPTPTLIIEPHPANYTGFPFITLIQYRKAPMLVIVDNMNDDVVDAFVLDLCGPEHVNEELLITSSVDWYNTNRHNFPISIEFSRRGITSQTSRIYRALSVEYISRIIGPAPSYPMGHTNNIKRRRKKSLPVPASVIENR